MVARRGFLDRIRSSDVRPGALERGLGGHRRSGGLSAHLLPEPGFWTPAAVRGAILWRWRERGYRVLGVDLQDSYLGEARERAGKIKNSPDFIRADLREFKPEKTLSTEP